MAVRLKIKIRIPTLNREITTSALVNTGFETEDPQIIIPIKLGERLGLTPLPPNAKIIELGTAGGPTKMYLLRNTAEVKVLVEDKETRYVKADILISSIEEEVLLNDKVTEELGIVILLPASGKWRFIDDKPDIIRPSIKPEYW